MNLSRLFCPNCREEVIANRGVCSRPKCRTVIVPVRKLRPYSYRANMTIEARQKVKA